MEQLFTEAAAVAGRFVEAMAVLVIVYGACEALVQLLPVVFKPAIGHGRRKAIWRRFGTWLVLGLEFTLAADIIASVVSPSWEDIGQLGAIAVIRTFLNYFLERDLEDTVETEATSATT